MYKKMMTAVLALTMVAVTACSSGPRRNLRRKRQRRLRCRTEVRTGGADELLAGLER